MTVRLVRLEYSIGTVPDNPALLARSSCSKDSSLPSSVGRVAVKRFDESNNETRPVHRPISDGIGPVKSAESAFNKALMQPS